MRVVIPQRFGHEKCPNEVLTSHKGGVYTPFLSKLKRKIPHAPYVCNISLDGALQVLNQFQIVKKSI